YRISSQAPANYANKALDGFISLISKSTYTPARKLLEFRKAMELARSGAQKSRILGEVQKTETFQALMYAGGFLKDPELKQAAAQTVMNIALDHKEYYGREVKQLLDETINTLEGQDSDYQKEALR